VIVLDTSILVYAAGADHPLRAPSRRILEAASRGAMTAVTSTHVIEEFVHVRARRRSRDDAVELGRHLTDLVDGLAIFAAHGGLGSFDAVLAAVAIRRGAVGLVAADRAFASVPGLPYVDPADPTALDALLGGRRATSPD
jgi:uncharacterized protein